MATAEQRLRGMLGFAMRAGKVAIGTETVCKSMAAAKTRPSLVLIACDVSAGTLKKIVTKCEFYGIKSVQINIGADELGDLLGKTYSPATVGIMDDGFAKQINIIADMQ